MAKCNQLTPLPFKGTIDLYDMCMNVDCPPFQIRCERVTFSSDGTRLVYVGGKIERKTM